MWLSKIFNFMINAYFFLMKDAFKTENTAFQIHLNGFQRKLNFFKSVYYVRIRNCYFCISKKSSDFLTNSIA